MPLGRDEKLQLLELARRALEGYVRDRQEPPIPLKHPTPELRKKSPAFVSLHAGDELRGCIGSLQPDGPLCETVQHLAVETGTRDSRFEPVTAAELDSLNLEISVLTDFEWIGGADEVEIGVHGLIIECQGKRGLLLPQVAPRYNWTPEQFIDETCVKAGLSPVVWRKGPARIKRFKAEIFSADAPPTALFACIHNSCRSQMAEGWASQLGKGWIRPSSGGSAPSGKVNPDAIAIMKEAGVDISGHTSKGIDQVESVDILVLMGCGDACPHIRTRRRIDWAIEDPSGKGHEAFVAARDEIRGNVQKLIEELKVAAVQL